MCREYKPPWPVVWHGILSFCSSQATSVEAIVRGVPGVQVSSMFETSMQEETVMQYYSTRRTYNKMQEPHLSRTVHALAL